MRTKKRIRGQIAIILALCMIFTFIPWIDAESVYADGADTAKVYKIYATFSEEGEPSDFVIADTATSGKKLFGLFIVDGSYTMTDSDNGLFIIANNANVTTDGKKVSDFRLSGDSSISMDTYTVSSTSGTFKPFDKIDENYTGEKPDVVKLFEFYNSVDYIGNEQKGEDWVGPKPYSYEITANTTINQYMDIDTLTVNEGVELTITGGNDEGKTEYWAGVINVNSAIVNGSILIKAKAANCEYSNLFAIENDGSLTVGNEGSLTGEEDAILDIRERATVTGIKLYERFDGSTNSGVECACNGQQSDTFSFIFDADAQKWVFPPGEDNPGEGEPGENNPGNDNPPHLESPQEIKDYIEGQKFAFGDWYEDESDNVNVDDLKMGMACQIFYPKFRQNDKLKTEYGINSYNDLSNCITIQKADAENITAIDGQGREREISGYTYTVTLTPSAQATEAEKVTATGVVYGLAFSDDSTYAKNSRGCIIAVTEKNGTKKYHLRCAQAYSEDTTNDVVNLISGDTSNNEGTILVVDDFDVTYDAERGEYRRGVSIFGNGASLDALFSQEEDSKLVAYQGRNDNFIGDINRDIGKNWASIFGIFTFCQKDFVGSRIKGSGAEGSTPSWAFNQYPIYSTADGSDTKNEAVVYFGNHDVTIEPVDNVTGFNSTITGIESVTTVDNLPAEAASITKETDKKWNIRLESDYYDTVKVKIVYQLDGGGTKDSYINIHRVGIDILSGTPGGGATSMTLFHGTDNGPEYTPEGNYVIWGTYYYPTAEAYKQLVDLYVTYTWTDGSISREIIKNKAALNLGYNYKNTGNCASSDFILYDGTRNEAPSKIQAIVVASGFDDTNATEFTGAKFGAGKGVSWTNYYRNEN